MKLSRLSAAVGALVSLSLIAVNALAQQRGGAVSPASAPDGILVAASEWIKIDGTGGRKFLAAIYRPEGPGPFPVVVLLPGAQGLTDVMFPIAQRLARAGMLAVVGCYQAGEAKTVGTARCSEATPQGEWVADPARHSGKELIAAARSLSDAKPDRVGLFGFSRGGQAGLWAASTGANVQAVVADAPAHKPVSTPAPASTLTVVDTLAAPVLIIHGTADKTIPIAQSHDYERAARAAGKQIEVEYVDGAGHVVSVDPAFQDRTIERAIRFLKQHLSASAGS